MRKTKLEKKELILNKYFIIKLIKNAKKAISIVFYLLVYEFYKKWL